MQLVTTFISYALASTSCLSSLLPHSILCGTDHYASTPPCIYPERHQTLTLPHFLLPSCKPLSIMASVQGFGDPPQNPQPQHRLRSLQQVRQHLPAQSPNSEVCQNRQARKVGKIEAPSSSSSPSRPNAAFNTSNHMPSTSARLHYRPRPLSPKRK